MKAEKDTKTESITKAAIEEEKQSPRRIHAMDELRGLCVILMVLFHALYTIGLIYNVGWATTLLNIFSPLQPFFAGIFILISGISSMFSRSNTKRGLKLAGVSIIVTLVTVFFVQGSEIWFGILHFLSICMILFGLLKKPLEKVKPLWGIVVCLILYIITSGIPYRVLGIPGFLSISLPDALYSSDIFAPLGFHTRGFYSSDYFPLLPNIFIFFAGGFLGIWAKRGLFPETLYKLRSKPLSFIGKHSLIIYVLHQPLIYGICWLVFRFI